jgi:metal-responsive CopG/Arc/MetJ family transcriptional regulator
VRQIDEWRRRQPDLPSRSEAIRRLIEAGLNAASNDPKKEGLTKS